MTTAPRVLVTGGAQGVGAAVANQLDRDGFDVVVADLQKPIESRFEFHQVDLSDSASIRALVAADSMSGLAGLVNVAGVPGTVDPQVVMAVNFAGLRLLTELCIERSNLTSVVHVSSLSAAAWAEAKDRLVPLLMTNSFEAALSYAQGLGMSSNEAYVFSKQAVVLLTQWQAAHFLERGVRVNCVSPGPVETRLLDDFRASMGEEHINRAIALQGRAATADDIASVIGFLMSDSARWVSGSNVNTDGGLHAVREYAKDRAAVSQAVSS